MLKYFLITAAQVLERERNTLLPANTYPETTPNWERDVLAETENILATMPDILSSPKTGTDDLTVQ